MQLTEVVRESSKARPCEICKGPVKILTNMIASERMTEITRACEACNESRSIRLADVTVRSVRDARSHCEMTLAALSFRLAAQPKPPEPQKPKSMPSIRIIGHSRTIKFGGEL